MTRSRARIAAPLAILLGGGLFFFFSRGGTGLSSRSLAGYAEVVDHPAAPLAAGRVARIAVRLGQHVKPGDVIAVMETEELEIKRKTARLELARANAELVAEEVVAGAAVARAELQVLRLQATQVRDQAQLEEVRKQLARLEKLAEDKLVQARDVEAERLREADLSASVEVLGAAAKQRQAGLGRTTGSKVSAGQLAKRLEPLREEVRLREETVKLADVAFAEATVRAHVEGTVAALLHHAGDVVPAGTELVRIATGREGRVVCWVPERLVRAIDAGQDVRMRGMSFLSPTFGGRVAELSPEIEEVPPRARTSPQVPTWGRRVEIEAWPPHPLVLGEAVHVRF